MSFVAVAKGQFLKGGRMLFGRHKRVVKRILIVEDEPLVAFDNEVMIAGAGYTIVGTVDRARDALELIAREQAAGGGLDEERGVDLILTDITLTGARDGLQLAAEARKLGVPVLFATAAPPEGGEAVALGVLLKPYGERQLKAALKAVEQIISGKKQVKVPDGVILYPPAGD